jgi:hypothetical protein
MVVHLLVPAALWVRIQTSLKKQNRRHKQRSGQHTLARQKNIQKKLKNKLTIGRYFHSFYNVKKASLVRESILRTPSFKYVRNLVNFRKLKNFCFQRKKKS